MHFGVRRRVNGEVSDSLIKVFETLSSGMKKVSFVLHLQMSHIGHRLGLIVSEILFVLQVFIEHFIYQILLLVVLLTESVDVGLVFFNLAL